MRLVGGLTGGSGASAGALAGWAGDRAGDGPREHHGGRGSPLPLAAGQTMHVVGFDDARAFAMEDCAGEVWLEDTKLYGGASPFLLQVDHCVSVTLNRCAVGFGGPGMSVTDGTARLFGSTAVGGADGPPDYVGRPGIELLGASTLVLTGSTVTGGMICDDYFYCVAQDGGPGLSMPDAASTTRAFQSTLIGGPGNTGGEFGPGALLVVVDEGFDITLGCD